MDIGIIGSGHIGGTLARLFTAAGHDVVIANSRGPDTLDGLVDEVGGGLRAATVDEAARSGEVVVVAIPVKAVEDLPPDPFAGKIVVDANNYYPGRDGQYESLDTDATTSTEMLAAHLPGARVVKAFNTMNYRVLDSGGRADAPADERLAIFLAGDDAEANGVVAGLIEELGFAPVDTGGLADGGRRQQPGTPVYGADLTAAQARDALAA
jgi:8-hydroxy-5-deazaflavin:NADPH oxidoreductase